MQSKTPEAETLSALGQRLSEGGVCVCVCSQQVFDGVCVGQVVSFTTH